MQRVSLLVRETEAGWSTAREKKWVLGKTRGCIDSKITNHAHNKRRKKIRTSHCDCLLYISIPGRRIGIWTKSVWEFKYWQGKSSIELRRENVHRCDHSLPELRRSGGKERRLSLSERTRRHVLDPPFRATIRPWLSTGSRTRTLLFCPPATPRNCQGIDDEPRIFRPSSARSGPHPPVATSPRKHKPLIFDREALRAFTRSLCSCTA